MAAPLGTGSGIAVLVTPKSATRTQLTALPSSCLYSAKPSSVSVTRVEKLIALPPMTSQPTTPAEPGMPPPLLLLKNATAPSLGARLDSEPERLAKAKLKEP